MPIPQADEIAIEIKTTVQALLESREALNGRFSDTDANWGAGTRPGAFSSMQGLRAIFGALAALPEDRELWAIVKPAMDSLLAEWSETLDRLTSTNYGLDPYDADRSFERLRTEFEATAPYTETVSWSLSTAVAINFILPSCTTHLQMSVDPIMVEKTRDEIGRSVRLLIKLQADDGGWSWGSRSCLNAGHLYFTWSVVQGYADYFDYVLGESENEIGISPDHDTRQHLKRRDKSLEDDAKVSRDRGAQFLRDRYLGTAVTATGLAFTDLVTKDENGHNRITVSNPGSDLPLLYFYSYLLEALILSSYDRNDPTVVAARRADMDRLYTEIKRRFALVRPAGMARQLDTEQSTVQITLSGKQVVKGRVVNEVAIKDPGLWPQMLRTLVLYPYYVETPRYEDEDIVGSTGAYALLIGDRRNDADETGALLWDREAFNLSITVRALEGLIDVYDYVRLLSEREPEQVTAGASSEVMKVLADALYPHVRLRLRTDTEAVVVPPAAPAQETERPSEFDLRSRSIEAADSQIEVNFVGARTQLSKRVQTLDVQNVLEQVLGPEHEMFQQENPVAYEITKSVVVICIATVSRLLHEIVQEAVLSTAPIKELTEYSDAVGGEKGIDSLGKRVRLVLRELGRQEMASASRKEAWDVEAIVKHILSLAPPPAAPPPPRSTRRGTA
jgi:hypothetical protein